MNFWMFSRINNETFFFIKDILDTRVVLINIYQIRLPDKTHKSRKDRLMLRNKSMNFIGHIL